MSNSSLVDVTILSPNYNPRGSTAIKKITIHHAAGIVTAEGLGEQFADYMRQGSSNYGIGNDGRVGLYVPEDCRAWTSGSPENDYQAITIEVSNCEIGAEWAVSRAAYNKLIELCVDICKRNGIEKLNFTGDASGNLTMHRYFQATACPGEYLASRFQQIADEVNEKLKGDDDAMTAAERKEFEELKAQVESLSKIVNTYEKQDVYDNAATRWAYIDGNLPSFAKPTIKKMVDRGYLKGNGNNSLELSYTLLRVFVIMDRAGVFDGGK